MDPTLNPMASPMGAGAPSPDSAALQKAMMLQALKAGPGAGMGQPRVAEINMMAANAPGGGMGAPPAAMPGGLGSNPMQPQQMSPQDLMMMQQQMQAAQGQQAQPNPIANALMSQIPGAGGQ